MRKLRYSNTQPPATSFDDAPTPGAYVAVITAVVNHDIESYLEVEWDIDDGPYKGYYKKFRDEHPDWKHPGKYRKYYTPTALWAFRRFCASVSRSNGNFVFDGGDVNADERTLVGKRFGVVLQDKEYYSNSGDLRTKLEVFKEIPMTRVPYEPVPKVLTIEEQEARKAKKQGAAPAPAQPVPAPAYAQPAQAPAYAQAQPAQGAYRAQGQQPAYTQPQARQSAQAQAYAQFVDVSGDAEMMPFM